MQVKSTIRRSSGFTIVEMLVAMAIFGIILGGVLKVFDTSNYAYMVQEEVAAMQQNVRVSKMFVERDVRMSGCGIGDFYLSGTTVYPVEFQNAVGASGSDKLFINYMNYDASTCPDAPPDITSTGGPSPTSSEAEVEETFDNPPYDKWVNEFTCNGETYGGSPFEPFMALITSPDGSMSDIVYITTAQDVGGVDKVQNAPYPVGCGSDCNKVINTYPPGSTISYFHQERLTRLAYYITDNVLMRDTLDPLSGTTVVASDPIAEDIEDLQFCLGLDTDDDDVVDLWIPDASNPALTDDMKYRVRMIRISILGRTASEHRGYDTSRPAIEDNPAAGSTDGYRRKLLQVTVDIRNMGLS